MEKEDEKEKQQAELDAKRNNEQKVKRWSKKCSWLLRHGAVQEGLSMDAAGWVSVGDLQEHLSLNQSDLELVLTQNNKARFEVNDGLIRACQGHSLKSMPVTKEALEASWSIYNGSDSIWHGTHRGALEAIKREGIICGERSHVHLARSVHSRVGKRSNVSIFIEVSCAYLRQAGYEVFESTNGVILTRYVPLNCIVNISSFKA